MKKTILQIGWAIALIGCTQPTIQFPKQASVAAQKVILAGDSTAIYLGGYGSSMGYHAIDSCFYLLTDRGPNVDGISLESKIFPIPDYTPAIGCFRLKGDSLVLVKKINLKDQDGIPFTGLPNTQGDGVTGEVAYDAFGSLISNPSRGLDSEGLAIAPDGTFWISDEYAPFVMQFNKSGRLMRELRPGKGLPSYYARRRPNRGMEGLTISKDGARLYGIMQSPLYLHDKSTQDISVNNRLIEIDLTTGNTREFVYSMEQPHHVVSEICFVSDAVMLVLERDGDFPKDNAGFKKVYQINISRATDVSDKEIELLSASELNEKQITPVTKTLFVDILSAVPHYRHDKPEGIALIGDSILCVVNDDDFGISAAPNGRIIPKLDHKGNLDKNVIYFIPVQMQTTIK